MAMAALLSNGLAHAGGDDNPLLAKFMLDEFERGVESNDSTNFEAQAWIGKDLDKLWLNAEGGYKNRPPLVKQRAEQPYVVLSAQGDHGGKPLAPPFLQAGLDIAAGKGRLLQEVNIPADYSVRAVLNLQLGIPDRRHG